MLVKSYGLSNGHNGLAKIHVYVFQYKFEQAVKRM